MGIAENKRAAAQLIVALASVDKQAFDAVTRPDTRWWTAGMPGTYSRDEYFQFSKDASLLLKQPDFQMQTVGITAESDRVAIEGETRTELKDGRVYNNKYHFLLIFEEGRIKEVREYHDTQHARETFQGSTEENALAALFAGKTLGEQQALLARLERAGAALYRAWAAQEPDPAARAGLLGAAEREEQNAQALERLEARPRGGGG